VRKSLSALDANGWIRREKRVGQGKSWCWHIYTLLMPEGGERRSLPKRKGAERSSLPQEFEGGERGSSPSAEGGERRSTRTGTSFQEGREPRSADLDLKLASKSKLEENALTSDDKVVPVWTIAVDFLKTKTDKSERQIRSFVGLLRKNLRNDDKRLVELIETAKRQEIVEVFEWLSAVSTRGHSKAALPLYRSDSVADEALLDASLARMGVSP
jgi:hypothetical protein